MKNYKKQVVDRSINRFLKKNYLTLIDKEKLSEKLLMSQNNKIFMCYKNGRFYRYEINSNELTVTGIQCLRKNRTGKFNVVVMETDSDTLIHVLLRWKNHAGVLYPAYQIKLLR